MGLGWFVENREGTYMMSLVTAVVQADSAHSAFLRAIRAPQALVPWALILEWQMCRPRKRLTKLCPWRKTALPFTGVTAK